MSTVRDVIAEALTAHPTVRIVKINNEDGVAVCSGCRARYTAPDKTLDEHHRAHVADAVLAALREAGEVETSITATQSHQRICLPWEPVSEGEGE